MANPVISWYNSLNTAVVTTPFNFGVIDADDLSPFLRSTFGITKGNHRCFENGRLHNHNS